MVDEKHQVDFENPVYKNENVNNTSYDYCLYKNH